MPKYTQNPVLEAISDRRSIRGYKPDAIDEERLNALLQAALQAPSARNSQPWFFSVVRNQTILDEINSAVSEAGNQDFGDIFYAAPCVIFISCDPTSRWGRLDCGIAVENIALAAHAMGLGSVILGMPEMAFVGPKGPSFNERLKFPEGHAFAIAIAVGIPTTTKEAHPVLPDRITYIQ